MSERINDLWTRLETWLEKHSPATFEKLNPGASDEALDSAAAALGPGFAGEARAWFARHDGEQDDLDAVYGDWLLPLDRALSGREMLLSIEGGGEVDWQPAWLPVLADGAGNFRYVDLKSGAVRDFDHEGWVHSHMAASLGDLLEATLTSFERDQPVMDEDLGWAVDDDEWSPLDDLDLEELEAADLVG